MSRLPTPGQDNGNWGEILNDFLEQSHNDDGTLKEAAIPKSTDVTTDGDSDDKVPSVKAVKTYTDDKVGEVNTQLADIAQDMAELQNTGVDTTARADIAAMQKGPNGKPLKYVACVIRPTAGVWAFIEDALHSKIGVATISQDSSLITVNYDFVAGKVLSCAVTPDETLTAAGIACGASVSGDHVSIRVSKRSISTGAYIVYNGTSWVVNGATDVTAAFADGVLTITHPNLGTTYGAAVSKRDANSLTPILGSFGATTMTIKFYDTAGNQVTTPATSMKLYFTRNAPTIREVNPSDTANISQSGNLWIWGVFEAQ